jgi:uncharacterized protein YciI
MPALDIPRAMTPYFIGFAVPGDNPRREGTPEHLHLVQRHLAYIRTQIEAGRFVVAGPMADSGRVQGMVIISASTRDEALRLTAEDPAAAAGHFRYELRQAMLPSLASVRVTY